MNSCAICLEPIQTAGYTTSCAHLFHKACLREWMGRSATCPLCRSPCVIDPKDRYKVRSPKNAHTWCSGIDRLYSWYISFDSDKIILSSKRGIKKALPVKHVRCAHVDNQSVRIEYNDLSKGTCRQHLFLISDEAMQLVGAIGCFFQACKKRTQPNQNSYSTTSLEL